MNIRRWTWEPSRNSWATNINCWIRCSRCRLWFLPKTRNCTLWFNRLPFWNCLKNSFQLVRSCRRIRFNELMFVLWSKPSHPVFNRFKIWNRFVSRPATDAPRTKTLFDLWLAKSFSLWKSCWFAIPANTVLETSFHWPMFCWFLKCTMPTDTESIWAHFQPFDVWQKVCSKFRTLLKRYPNVNPTVQPIYVCPDHWNLCLSRLLICISFCRLHKLTLHLSEWKCNHFIWLNKILPNQFFQYRSNLPSFRHFKTRIWNIQNHVHTNKHVTMMTLMLMNFLSEKVWDLQMLCMQHIPSKLLEKVTSTFLILFRSFEKKHASNLLLQHISSHTQVLSFNSWACPLSFYTYLAFVYANTFVVNSLALQVQAPLLPSVLSICNLSACDAILRMARRLSDLDSPDNAATLMIYWNVSTSVSATNTSRKHFLAFTFLTWTKKKCNVYNVHCTMCIIVISWLLDCQLATSTFSFSFTVYRPPVVYRMIES